MSLPPGPRLPSPLQLVGLFGRTVPYLDRCLERYGTVFTIRLPRTAPMVYLAEPELIKAVWARDRVNGLPAGRRIVLEPLLGPRSVLIQEGGEHLRRRRLMLPPFHGERMRRYGSLMEEIVLRDVERWPVGKPFALLPRMQAITLDVILRTVFGTRAGTREDALRIELADVLRRTASASAQVSVLLAEQLGQKVTPFHRAVRCVDALIHEELRERRRAPDLAERDDIASMLMTAHDEDGNPLTDDELRDQLVTLLAAGHETTATALSWTFDALFRNPDVRERLERSLPDGDAYADAVVEEAMRIRPTVPDVGRTLGEPLTANGYELPAGTDVFASVQLLHRRADLFPEPAAFRPERFLDGSPSTYAWIPFGGGMRRCLGAAFAQFEMRNVLRTVLEHTRLEPATGRAEPIDRNPVTLVPRHGTPAVLVGRS
ncbi:MAG: Cytochrome P450 [uncultured Solirubrobacteraceae bacterium]|uniref:Cytochrome P450 n=1 Tax=uncultured Solirubrobacteraceae bacterium TaxID=1162706 RepID=A0A6J4TYU0_9ACTN|nr:MAG: Cytochrome P450 [uncultured Solirubrobacteraceae bacterium]